MPSSPGLRVYGPGGPYPSMRACAELFARRTGSPVEVLRGEPDSWAASAREDADLVYGGAEYMLEDLARSWPGLVDMSTALNLYPRQVGILVRPGNPSGARDLEDLGRRGLRLLDVQLERMEGFQERASPGRGNVARSVVTGEEGRAAWLADPTLEAWITYRSWHVAMPGQAEFLPLGDLPGARRFTPIALACRSQRQDLARAFVRFLQSEEAHEVFRQHGWD